MQQQSLQQARLQRNGLLTNAHSLQQVPVILGCRMQHAMQQCLMIHSISSRSRRETKKHTSMHMHAALQHQQHQCQQQRQRQHHQCQQQQQCPASALAAACLLATACLTSLACCMLSSSCGCC
jgi:hypothetical protein